MRFCQGLKLKPRSLPWLCVWVTAGWSWRQHQVQSRRNGHSRRNSSLGSACTLEHQELLVPQGLWAQVEVAHQAALSHCFCAIFALSCLPLCFSFSDSRDHVAKTNTNLVPWVTSAPFINSVSKTSFANQTVTGMLSLMFLFSD